MPFKDWNTVLPTISLGVDKFVNPWLGFGVNAYTTIGTGSKPKWNSHTAFDEINLSAAAKVNLTNAFFFQDGRQFFEPTPYIAVGWGHKTCPDVADPNYMTVRFGSEFLFSLGNARAWSLKVDPAVEYKSVRNLRFNSFKGHFHIGVGLVYHFWNSNNSYSWSKYSEEPPLVYERIQEVPVEKVVTKRVVTILKSTYLVTFANNSSKIESTAELDKIPTDATVEVVAYASPDGNAQRNLELSQDRANAVAKYLRSRGIAVKSATGKGAESNTAQRICLVTIVDN